MAKEKKNKGGKSGRSGKRKRQAELCDSPWCQIRDSPIHGRGLVATKDIPAGTRVIEYVGEKISKAESDRRGEKQYERAEETGEGSVYLFTLNKRYDIDGNVPWNAARLINHSCEPNCETDIIKGHIWIIALREIGEGEELFYNYGFDLEYFEHHPCLCGTDSCQGYIVAEEHWKALRKELKKRARKEKEKKKRKKRKKEEKAKARKKKSRSK